MEIDLTEELVNSKIVHLELLDVEKVNLVKNELGLDDDFNIDMIMLLEDSKK